jgi:two-component system response regulator
MSEPIDILLVEDSEDDAAFFEHALREAMPLAHLLVARDGVEAIHTIFGVATDEDGPPLIRPRVIVLDLKLPKVSGLEVLRRLKGNSHTRTIPVVALSSSKEKRDLAESYQSGANSYLVKPMDFDEFSSLAKALVVYWLQLNQAPKT